MAGEKTILIYTEDFDDLEELTDSDAGILLKAILQYMNDGTETERLNDAGDARVMFRYIRRRIDRDKKKYAEICQKRAESGRKGGFAKQANLANASKCQQNLANPSKAKQNLANLADNDNDNEYVNEYVNDNDNEASAFADEALDSAGAGLPDREKSMYEDKGKRIKFLKMMIRMYSSGGMRDDTILAEYRSELKRLEGG